MKKILSALLVLIMTLTFGSVEAKEKTCSYKEKKRCLNKGRADYIIVGLGTAGSVLTRYLTNRVDGKFVNSVLVLEAGKNRSNDPIVNAGPPVDLLDLAANPKYAITSIVRDANPAEGAISTELYSSGRMFFGSSAHNFLFTARGSSDVWNDLATSVGNSQWTYNNLLPYMKLLETFNGVTQDPSSRGFSGTLPITQTQPPLTVLDTLATAIASATGAPILDDFNVPSGNTAVSRAQQYISATGTQRSYGLNFLPASVMNFDGTSADGRLLLVKGGAQVNRVIFEGKKAIGVEYFLDNNQDEVFIAYANKEVILCAGCPLSAAILQRSGVGPSAVLSQPEVNVPVVVNNPLVGTGLKTHYGVLYAVNDPNHNFLSAPEIVSFSDGRNFFAPAGTGDNKRRFVTNYLAAPIALAPPLLLAALNINPATPGYAGFGWYLRPRSSGTAYIIDANPYVIPDIQYNLFSDGNLSDPSSDLSALIAIYKIINQVAANSGATMIYPPPSHFASDSILAQDALGGMTYSILTVTNHYVGTCNMGTNKSNGVVSSSDLHVFGTKGLRVADNSVYPFPETGNTGWSAYLMGIKAAAILGVPVLP